ncbi:hypothetical protein ACRAWD_22905 [Caulobacter segnis]
MRLAGPILDLGGGPLSLDPDGRGSPRARSALHHPPARPRRRPADRRADPGSAPVGAPILWRAARAGHGPLRRTAGAEGSGVPGWPCGAR